MKATLTSKGQITIPLVVRKSLRLKAGDVLDFDENASILTARRVIDPAAWNRAWEEFREGWRDPFAGMTSREVLDELRGPIELPAAGQIREK
jgi:AbrB family looped-hinge helix DNA binding protein